MPEKAKERDRATSGDELVSKKTRKRKTRQWGTWMPDDPDRDPEDKGKD